MLDKKNTVGLVNPPFSETSSDEGSGNGSKKLYDIFYDRMVEVADTFAFICPDSTDKLMPKFNKKLQQTATSIDTIGQPFDGITTKCMVVYSISGSKGTVGKVGVNKDDIANNYRWQGGPLNMTHYKQINGDHGNSYRMSDSDIAIYHKINTSGIHIKYSSSNCAKTNTLAPGWIVFLPQAMTGSRWADTPIVKSNGNNISAFNGLKYVVFRTLEEAESFVVKINSKEFIDQAVPLKKRNQVLPIFSCKQIVMD